MLKLEKIARAKIDLSHSELSHSTKVHRRPVDFAMSQLSDSSSSQAHLIRQFSTFYQFQSIPQACSDPQLKRVMSNLAEQIDYVVQAHDIWARYFLLHLYGEYIDYANLGLEDLAKTHLNDLVQHVVSQNPNYNQGLEQIHQAIVETNTATFSPQKSHFLDQPFSWSYKLMCAYLQQSGKHVAQDFFRRKISGHLIEQSFPLERCFSITIYFTLSPDKILRKFKFQQANKIRTYAESVLYGKLKDFICKESIVFKKQNLSRWGLLRQLTGAEIQRIFHGYSSNQIDHYKLAWKTFTEIYQHKQADGQQRLPEPDEQAIQHMSERYNQRCQEFDLDPVSAEGFMNALIALDEAARKYYTESLPSVGSVQTISSDMIELETDESVLANPTQLLEISEQQQHLGQLSNSLSDAFNTLNQQAKALLYLTYGFKFRGSEIGQILSVNQATVSRRLRDSRRALIKAVFEYLKEYHPEIDPLSVSCELNHFEDLIKEWIEVYCKTVLVDKLQQVALGYSKQTPCQIDLKVDKDIQLLLMAFQTELKQMLAVDLNKCDRTSKRLLEFIQRQIDSPPS